MKQFSLFALLFCFLSSTAIAATISGKVFSTATCGPVSGVKVIVRDSLTNWRDSAVTNSAGVYTITIPSSVTAPNDLFTRITNCGSTYSDYTSYTGANVTYDLFVCGTPKVISGYVGLGGSYPGGPEMVYLIRRDVVPVTLDTTLTAVDSTSITNGFYTFRYPCAPTGTYLVKAVLLPSHPNYSSYLLAYHDSALNWSKGAVLTAAQLGGTARTDVNLPAGINPGGPGFIGGSVLLGANKSTAVGDPLSSRILLLVNATTNKPVGYTYSNATGKFNFSNLAYGTYRIFGDAAGKTNPMLTLTLSAAKPGYNNILFEENNKTFKGQIGGLSVGKGNALAGVSVYPNPVTDHVQISGLNTIGGDKSVVMTDVTGAVIATERFAQGADAKMSTSNLPAGVYLLQVTTEAGSASFRIVK